MKLYAIGSETVIKDPTDLSILKDYTPISEYKGVFSRYGYAVVKIVLLSEFLIPDFRADVGVVEGPNTLKNAGICLNCKGFNPDGTAFLRSMRIEPWRLYTLFFGFDLSKAEIGVYRTVATIGDTEFPIELTLTDDPVLNEGADEGEGLARLKWLNDRMHLNRKIPKGFEPVTLIRNEIGFQGRALSVGNNGLPEQCTGYFSRSGATCNTPQRVLFSRPVELEAEGHKFKFARIKISERKHAATVFAEGKSDDLRYELKATARYEGTVEYRIDLTAERELILNDVSLMFSFVDTPYLIGLGSAGGPLTDLDFRWSQNEFHDAVWIGNVDLGAQIRFLANRRTAPIAGKFYHCRPFAVPSDSWDNFGNGGIAVRKEGNGAVLRAYTGKLVMPASKTLTLSFTMALTPFAGVDLKKRLGTRRGVLSQKGAVSNAIAEAANSYCNLLEIEKNSEIMPVTNDPIGAVREIKHAVLKAHNARIGVRIPFGNDVISSRNADARMFRRFEGELALRKNALPAECLANPEFYSTQNSADRPFPEVPHSAVITAKNTVAVGKEKGVEWTYLAVPQSRLDNYLVSAIEYMISNTCVDGIRLPYAAYSRTLMERIKKAFVRKRGIKGSIALDLPECNLPACGNCTAISAVAEVLPFVDSIVAEGLGGENSDYILTALSGIPFGIAAETTEDVDLAKAMLYAVPLRFDSKKHKDMLDDFHRVLIDYAIPDGKMFGYWDPANPVRVDNRSVLATSYISGDNMLVAVYNTSPKRLRFDMGIENKLGYTSVGKKVFRPAIAGYCSGKRISFNKSFSLKGHSGMLIVVAKRKK